MKETRNLWRMLLLMICGMLLMQSSRTEATLVSMDLGGPMGERFENNMEHWCSQLRMPTRA